MRNNFPLSKRGRARPLIGSALTIGLGTVGFGAPLSVHAANTALEEVIVTAQKRDESVQDVPVSITALTQESLETNRVANVTDLNGLAPNLAARPAPGGAAIASFSMRGITSYGVVPGSDKEISIYLDGVYIGTPRGSIFNLPDIAQLEVLRGPQGTLFGRNATAGAINVVTRDPSGEFGLRQELSFGNNDYQRTRTSIESPTWGPFSFLLTYANEERDGDIKNNASSDIYWNRTAFDGGTARVAKRLGDKDAETYFLATKFEPTDTLTMTYKFDKAIDHGTPAANVNIAVNQAALGGLLAFLDNPSVVQPNTDGTRPSSANDSFATASYQENFGHSLTTTIDATDSVSVKNITAYRKSEITANTDLLGLGSLSIGGMPFCLVCAQNSADFDQWSTELQVNYESDLLTLTVGSLYFESKERAGYKNSGSTISNSFFPNYVVPAGNISTSYVDAQSLAFYTQAEFHVTDEIDLVGGYRWSRDRKTGEYVSGTRPNENHDEFRYSDSRPSWMLGVNYKPQYGTLIYGKYSEAFVSGGSVAAIDFEPEIAKSWEAGVKADFLESTLRTNFSVFHVNYEDVQSAQSGINLGVPVSTVVVNGGDTTSYGFEWEGSALVGYGVTLNASTGYTHVDLDPSQILLNSVGFNVYPGSSFESTLIPDWTGALSAQYESNPLFGSAYIAFNVSGNWHSKIQLEPNPGRITGLPGFIEETPAGWTVNSRLALRDIDLGWQNGTGEIGLWGKNLTDNDDPNFILNFGNIGESASYQEARSYGVDLMVKF